MRNLKHRQSLAAEHVDFHKLIYSINRYFGSLHRRAFPYITTNVCAELFYEYSSNEKCSNKSNTKKDRDTKKWDISDPTGSARCSGWQKNTLSPPSMSDAHDFLACVEWQKGHGYVPVLHVSSVSAISGAEYKWDAVWCTLSSPRYLLLWNAAVTSLNI